MTKEEKELTITYLTEMQEEYIEGEGYERHPLPEYYALDMAIKALEQQPSDDCVSRQATLDAIIKELCIKDESYLLQSEKVIYNVVKNMPPATPTEKKDDWIPLVWDEYPTVDLDGNDDYVYAVDYSVPMPKEDEWVLVTDENHNIVKVQYDGYDFGDYARENILAWQPLPKPYEEKRGSEE